MKPPILILSFDRTDYLRQTLESLAAQPDIANRQIFLFQDGATNIFSRRECCDRGIPDWHSKMARDIIPHIIPMVSQINLGIALNFDRAERFVFGKIGCQADAAMFFEDDYVLGPHYLAMLDQMLDLAARDERIGYVTAQGIKNATEAQQRQHCHATQPMSHNWAFGLTRRQWLRQRPWVSQYLDIVRNVDYLHRDHMRIADLFHSWGLGVPGTSQDIAKSHACLLSGAAKVNTYACFGRYIGARGVHFTEDQFTQSGYGSNFIYPKVVSVTPPSSGMLMSWRDIARQSGMAVA